MKTHKVFNQVQALAGDNAYVGDVGLQSVLRTLAPDLINADLRQLGAQLSSAEMQAHARLAQIHKPVLHSHSRTGERIDQVEFHPSYHTLMRTAMQAGLHGLPWQQAAQGDGHAHLRRAAGFYLFTGLEASVLCPISMTYAVAPALAANPAIHSAWSAGLASRHYDARFAPYTQKSGLTMGMGMTEKQGGSDVRANTSQALWEGEDDWGARYRITGHKWFFSAPMCDAFLVLAQTPQGLSCFFLPRILPSGEVNAIAVQRLKDKLGNHANASSEVEFHAATAWRVGPEGHGVAQILQMGTLTRLDCALGTAGLMRRALVLALHHARHRQAFGKRLADQPLMQNVLADLALESEAATALALRLAHALDRQAHDAHEALLARVLTPVAKFWICKRGSAFGQEAMECLGGNGYVEEGGEGVMARIYREMPLNSIWEGAGNIMALDLLRALRKGDVLGSLQRELAPALGRHAALDRLAERLAVAVDLESQESTARRLIQDVALSLQAALLAQTAPEAVFHAFCDSRLASSWGSFGCLPAHIDAAAIAERAWIESA